MRVLVACEVSGVVRDAFAAKGHDAWSNDILQTGTGRGCEMKVMRVRHKRSGVVYIVDQDVIDEAFKQGSDYVYGYPVRLKRQGPFAKQTAHLRWFHLSNTEDVR